MGARRKATSKCEESNQLAVFADSEPINGSTFDDPARGGGLVLARLPGSPQLPDDEDDG
jgi:hypothetical protein